MPRPPIVIPCTEGRFDALNQAIGLEPSVIAES
jgi:hypothetical protein